MKMKTVQKLKGITLPKNFGMYGCLLIAHFDYLNLFSTIIGVILIIIAIICARIWINPQELIRKIFAHPKMIDSLSSKINIPEIVDSNLQKGKTVVISVKHSMFRFELFKTEIMVYVSPVLSK